MLRAPHILLQCLPKRREKLECHLWNYKFNFPGLNDNSRWITKKDLVIAIMYCGMFKCIWFLDKKQRLFHNMISQYLVSLYLYLWETSDDLQKYIPNIGGNSSTCCDFIWIIPNYVNNFIHSSHFKAIVVCCFKLNYSNITETFPVFVSDLNIVGNSWLIQSWILILEFMISVF